MSVRERLKDYWKQNRWKIYFFLISFIIVFALKATNTFWTVLDEEWQKMESPYDIQKEYQRTTILSKARIALMKIGLSDDNFISNAIKRKQDQYYESVKSKVPADDVVIDVIWINKKYLPYIFTHKNNRNLSSQLEALFDNLILKKSKIKLINNKLKYVETSNLILYFLKLEPSDEFLKIREQLFNKIRNLLSDREIQSRKYPYVILEVEYISLIFNKLRTKYQNNWQINTCIDQDYILLSSELKTAQYLIENLNKENKADKIIKRKIEYITNSLNLINNFNEKICSISE